MGHHLYMPGELDLHIHRRATWLFSCGHSPISLDRTRQFPYAQCAGGASIYLKSARRYSKSADPLSAKVASARVAWGRHGMKAKTAGCAV